MSKIKYQAEGKVHTWSMDWSGRELIIKSGQFAHQANAAVTVQYGDTVLLATAVMSKNIREGLTYFPLLVDFEEKFYAAGKIKGSRFIKREGRPSDEAILSGRIVDRSIRPFFDDSSRFDIQVVIQALSWDGVNDPDSLAIIAASAALHISDIPWSGPVAALRVNQVDGQLVVNASYEQREVSDFDLLVSVREKRTIMLEAEGKQAEETVAVAGIKLAIEEAQAVLKLIEAMREKIGVPKRNIQTELTADEKHRQTEIKKLTEELVSSKITDTFAQSDKTTRNEALDKIKEELAEQFKDDAEYTKEDRSLALDVFENVLKKVTKDLYLNKNDRIDGRQFDEVRSLDVQVGVLPRPHGTGLFQRGETQALSVLTLGPPSSEQILDTMEETDTKKRYMHHYNFPGFSVGEVRPNRGAGRREIGHGALAEKALINVLPSKEDFPYTIRIVSEIMGSNGSSSMAATCGSTLSLMDAGVPIKAPVAGIAMGIMTDDDPSTSSGQGKERYKIMTDIQGAEDHYGEMDFKVAGTKTGITAIQLDVKNLGITLEMAKETLTQAKTARLAILDAMLQVIPESRKELSKYAPRIYTLRIDPEKIGDVIGPKGKIINEIIDTTGVAIDIEDDGLVLVTSTESSGADKAIAWIKDLTREITAGEVFDGKVVRIMDFGAFVEVLPGKDGLVHVSEIAPFRVNQVTDLLQVGDQVKVKVQEIDDQGRVNLSIKETDHEFPADLVAKAKAKNDSSSDGQRFNGKDRSRRFNKRR
jgi:polyribonucleotide nucleotidyltransferase